MFINNRDINIYNAKVVKKEIGTSNFEMKQEWVDKALNPLLFSSSNKYTIVNVELVTKGATRQELETNISKLTKDLQQSTIKFKDIDFYFDVFTQQKQSEFLGVDDNDEMYVSSLVFELASTYKYKLEKVVQVNKVTTATIINNGTLDTPVTLEITPINDIIDMTIEGFSNDPIKFKHLKMNQTTIINTDLGTVTMNGVNKFPDTELWQFPRLKPGNNSVKFSRNSCDIKVKFKERYM